MMTSALKYFNERKSSKVSRHDDSESVFEHDVANAFGYCQIKRLQKMQNQK